jgi:hypothetical protein
MRPKFWTYGHNFWWCLIIATTAAISLCVIETRPIVAQSPGDYFQFSYDPVNFSQDEIHGSEDFSATIRGKVVCTNDLPVSVGEASTTWSVTAQHKSTGNVVALNSKYTEAIKPFPSKKGDTFEINQIVSLRFPDNAESGDYDVIANLLEAKAKVAFAWVEVTEYLPRSQVMGLLKYTSATGTSTLSLASTPAPMTPDPTPASLGRDIAWWVWPVIAVAVATTAVNIICLLKHRSAKRTDKQQKV